jgi:hypothetical protein
MRWADDSKQILLFDLHTGDWTWSQYDLAVDQGMDYIKSVDHDVAAIVLSAAAMPEGNTITHLLRTARIQPDNLTLYIVVGGNALIRTTNNILMRMYTKLRIIFAASEAQAYELAAEQGFFTDGTRPQ